MNNPLIENYKPKPIKEYCWLCGRHFEPDNAKGVHHCDSGLCWDCLGWAEDQDFGDYFPSMEVLRRHYAEKESNELTNIIADLLIVIDSLEPYFHKMVADNVQTAIPPQNMIRVIQTVRRNLGR